VTVSQGCDKLVQPEEQKRAVPPTARIQETEAGRLKRASSQRRGKQRHSSGRRQQEQ
jgi:hypothetical protein